MTVLRHGDYPVSVNSVFVPRVQSVNVDNTQNGTAIFEMGNFTTVGTNLDPARDTGSITWYPLNNLMERLFAGYSTSGSTLNLSELFNATGVLVKTPKLTMGAAKVTSLEYGCQAETEWQATVNFTGGYSLASNSITATTPTGVPCYRGSAVTVAVGGTNGVRVAGISFRVTIQAEPIFQLGSSTAISVAQSMPTVSCDIDFYESPSMAGNVVLTTPADIVITVGGVITYTLRNMISANTITSHRGAVNGNVTRRYSYMMGASHTSYGLQITSS